MIRVFIVDDHPLVIEGIHALLKNEKDIAWVGQAMNAQSCIGFFVNNTADVVLMDISMPGMDGLELLKNIRGEKLVPTATVIMLTNQADDEEKAKALGVDGYIIKATTIPSEVVEKVLQVYKNKNK